MRVSEIRVKQIRVNQGLGVIALLNVCTSSIGNMTVLMNDSMFFFFFAKYLQF